MHSNCGHEGKYPFLAIFFLFDNTQKVHLGLKGYRGVIIIVLALAAFRLGYLYDKTRRLKNAFFQITGWSEKEICEKQLWWSKTLHGAPEAASAWCNFNAFQGMLIAKSGEKHPTNMSFATATTSDTMNSILILAIISVWLVWRDAILMFSKVCWLPETRALTGRAPPSCRGASY